MFIFTLFWSYFDYFLLEFRILDTFYIVFLDKFQIVVVTCNIFVSCCDRYVFQYYRRPIIDNLSHTPYLVVTYFFLPTPPAVSQLSRCWLAILWPCLHCFVYTFPLFQTRREITPVNSCLLTLTRQMTNQGREISRPAVTVNSMTVSHLSWQSCVLTWGTWHRK